MALPRYLTPILLALAAYSSHLSACTKTLALVANNGHKLALLEFAEQNLPLLKNVNLIGTGATARKLAQEYGLKVSEVNHGPDGGDVDIAHGLIHGSIHALFFYIDAGVRQPHDEDIGMLFRQATRLNVPFAPNPATGFYLLEGMRAGGHLTDGAAPTPPAVKRTAKNHPPVVVLSANDSHKADLIDMVRKHLNFFKQVKIRATGNTARLLQTEFGLDVMELPEGRQGGNLAIETGVNEKNIDAVFSFRDVSSLSGYDEEAKNMIRSVLVNDLPFAANPLSGHFLIQGMLTRGFLRE